MTGVIYLDLDRTLLDADGRIVAATLDTLDLVRASARLPVLVTGRSCWAAVPMARALGIDDVICELGAVVHADGIHHLTAPDSCPVPRAELLAALDHPSIGEHEPGAPRRAGVVLRSALPAAAVTARLARAGIAGWHAVDNGPSHEPARDGRSARVVHLVPAGIHKATGVRAHQRLRDLDSRRCAMVGDSPADLACAGVVGRTVLVRSDDATVLASAAGVGVPITGRDGARGALEAVTALLAAPTD